MNFESGPPIVHIVGRKRVGKTDLISKIIRLLLSKGYRVGAVRHSPHAHQLDPQGTDTEAFRKAGAIGSALVSAQEADLFLPSTLYDEKLAHIRRVFFDCHIILVEGGLRNSREKIEVVPKEAKPLCEGDNALRAIVGDCGSVSEIPCFLPDEVEKICTFIENRFLKPGISAAILAGGQSRRLGRNKAFLQVNGKPIIERIFKTICEIFSHIKIITNTPNDYHYLDAETATDLRPGCGPLSGIHTALALSPTEYVFIVSCDLPLLSREQIKPLLSQYPGADLTIYKHKQFEPLCAVYRRTCLPALEDLIDHSEYRIIDLCAMINVNVVRTDWSEAFQGINTQEDYQRVLAHTTE
jgi:molybdopterin-guanine dinucleotide biosynthesis protein MobB